MPYPVQEIYPAAFAGRVVVAGGIVDGPSDGVAATARTVMYAPSSDRWSEGPRLPAPRHHAGLVATRDQVLAIGGFAAGDDGFWQMQRSVFSMPADLKAWRAEADLPAPRAEFVAGDVAGRVIVAGGRMPRGDRNRTYFDHVDVAETLALDTDGRRWRVVAPLPTARNSAAGAVLEGRLHVVGGRALTAAGLQNLMAHETYDPVADRWEVRAPLPQAQGGLAAAALGGRLYAFGGEVLSPRPAVFAEVWEYDPQTDAWHHMSPMPIPRHGLGAVALEGTIHIVGGATHPGAKGRSDRHEAFHPD